MTIACATLARSRSVSGRRSACHDAISSPISRIAAATARAAAAVSTCATSMVAAQIALSLTLLTAGGIFARTTTQAAAGRPGYSYDHLILALADTRLAGVEDARIAPSIRRSSLACDRRRASSRHRSRPAYPSGIHRTAGRWSASDRASVARCARARIASSVPTTSGCSACRCAVDASSPRPRNRHPARRPSRLIDEVLARELFEGVDPIGQMIRVARGTRETPGLAPASRWRSSVSHRRYARKCCSRRRCRTSTCRPGVTFASGMYVQVRLAEGADERAALDGLRAHIRDVNAAVPILRLTSMQAFHDASLELWALKATAYAFTLLGALAMLLAAVGVYGVRAYTVALQNARVRHPHGARREPGPGPRSRPARRRLADGRRPGARLAARPAGFAGAAIGVCRCRWNRSRRAGGRDARACDRRHPRRRGSRPSRHSIEPVKALSAE